MDPLHLAAPGQRPAERDLVSPPEGNPGIGFRALRRPRCDVEVTTNPTAAGAGLGATAGTCSNSGVVTRRSLGMPEAGAIAFIRSIGQQDGLEERKELVAAEGGPLTAAHVLGEAPQHERLGVASRFGGHIEPDYECLHGAGASSSLRVS